MSHGYSSFEDVLKANVKEVQDFNAWIGDLPHPHKLVIAGNHDFLFQYLEEGEAQSMMTNFTYLQDRAVTIEGKVFYGSPWQPWFGGWAFNARPEEIRDHWSKIPEDTDVLITHGPPHRTLDTVGFGKRSRNVGCPLLRDAVLRVTPEVHAFGHVHTSHARKDGKYTTSFNAALVNSKYKIDAFRRPHTYDLGEAPWLANEKAPSAGTCAKLDKLASSPKPTWGK